MFFGVSATKYNQNMDLNYARHPWANILRKFLAHNERRCLYSHTARACLSYYYQYETRNVSRSSDFFRCSTCTYVLILKNNVGAIFILYDWLLHSFSRQCPKAGTRAWRHVVCIRTNSALSVDLEAELWTRLFRYPLPIRLTLPLLTLPQRKSEKTTLDLSGMAFVI